MASPEKTVPTIATSAPDVSFAIYFAQEMQLFFKHIQEAALKYSETKELPQSIFPGEPTSSVKKIKKDKTKRKPSAYNLYVRDALEKLKSDPTKSDSSHRSLFTEAVSLWSKLSDEQKLAWAAAHGMEHVDSGEDTPPAAATPTAVKKAPALEPEAPPTQPATEEDGKKKKKKHHKDKDSEHKSEKKDKKKRKKVCVLFVGGKKDGCVWKCGEQHRGDCRAVCDTAVGCNALR
ncbi:hypothetical protein QBZ16_000582 [Prototheca wickerhamii]|uniref:HMG box domain-containing protein n=1 Tax=Prototheca wickerhamii TaxID=3111 RepID=A0AAD9IN10_PROWI|nr:hypothetical protein QBZ16_000582 [Prototheca wickerhamii]